MATFGPPARPGARGPRNWSHKPGAPIKPQRFTGFWKPWKSANKLPGNTQGWPSQANKPPGNQREPLRKPTWAPPGEFLSPWAIQKNRNQGVSWKKPKPSNLGGPRTAFQKLAPPKRSPFRNPRAAASIHLVESFPPVLAKGGLLPKAPRNWPMGKFFQKIITQTHLFPVGCLGEKLGRGFWALLNGRPAGGSWGETPGFRITPFRNNPPLGRKKRGR